MSHDLDKDIDLIEEAITRFVQSTSRPRAWERMRAHAGIDLDHAGAKLLHVLEQSQGPDCRLSDLAHKMGIEAPSVSRKVQQLESEGLVERVSDPIDRRASVLKITAKGQQVVERLHQAHHELYAEVLRNWPAADRTAFAELFNRLSEDFALYSEGMTRNTKMERNVTT